MMDVSLGDREKEVYIVDVRLNEEDKTYVVTYADGRKTEDEFSVHNFAAAQYRMKQQFLDNKGKFVDTMEYLQCQEIVKEFKTIIYSMAGVMFATSLNLDEVALTIFLSVVGLYNAYKALSSLFKLWMCQKSKKGANNVEKFVREMEHYTLDVEDPNTGRIDEWYYYNISDVNPSTDLKELERLSKIFTPEYKEEESKRIGELLRKNFRREAEKAR